MMLPWYLILFTGLYSALDSLHIGWDIYPYLHCRSLQIANWSLNSKPEGAFTNAAHQPPLLGRHFSSDDASVYLNRTNFTVLGVIRVNFFNHGLHSILLTGTKHNFLLLVSLQVFRGPSPTSPPEPRNPRRKSQSMRQTLTRSGLPMT